MPNLKQRLLEVLLSDDEDGNNDQAPDSPATDGAPSVTGESEAAPPAPPKPAQEPAKQDEDIAAQLKAMQTQLDALQTENATLRATRLPTPNNALSSQSEPDVDRMSTAERVKYYKETVQPQLAKESELAQRR